ncbi:hypothetical protein B0H13DRAFT_2311702 [Mycena leptocephala]|nr:hypothetical protein B0H13DRAFT_2311702 [Mycena leptocephala]
MLLLASLFACDFQWIHSALTAYGPRLWRPRILILHNLGATSCDALALRTGLRLYSRSPRLLDARPFYCVPFWRKSEVQDTVYGASPTTTLYNALLHRSISCSILEAFRAAPNQRASPRTHRMAPNACPPFTAVSPLPAVLLDAAAPALTATSSAYAACRRGVYRNPWMQQKTAHTAFPRLQGRERWALSVPSMFPLPRRILPVYSAPRWNASAPPNGFSVHIGGRERSKRSAPYHVLAIVRPRTRTAFLQERALNLLAYLRSQSQHRTSFAVRAWEPLGIGLSLSRDCQLMYLLPFFLPYSSVMAAENLSHRPSSIHSVERCMYLAFLTPFHAVLIQYDISFLAIAQSPWMNRNVRN